MKKQKSNDELHLHKQNALDQLDTYISSMIVSNNPKQKSKAEKLSYWLEDYTKFLSFEKNFTSDSLKRYKRGDILKVHLGYNIGSEEGGLHYAVVIEKNNSIYNPVVTIIPLTSRKPNKDISNLHSGEVFLGHEIFFNLSDKFTNTFSYVEKEHQQLQDLIKNLDVNDPTIPSILDELSERETILEKKLSLLEGMKTEIFKMKKGSIALVNQITTISKIRIYDPKTSDDILSGIRLSNEGLDKIDEEIRKKYMK